MDLTILNIIITFQFYLNFTFFTICFPSEHSRMVGKVCIIGGGPSGLAVLAGFAKMQREGQVNFNFLKSYSKTHKTAEKQDDIQTLILCFTAVFRQIVFFPVAKIHSSSA